MRRIALALLLIGLALSATACEASWNLFAPGIKTTCTPWGAAPDSTRGQAVLVRSHPDSTCVIKHDHS